MRNFLRNFLWFIEALFEGLGRAYRWLREVPGNLQVWAAEPPVAEQKATVERRRMRFAERRGMRFAEWETRVTELQSLLASQRAARKADQHMARLWAVICILIAVSCSMLLVLTSLVPPKPSPAASVSVTAPGLEELARTGIGDFRTLRDQQVEILRALRPPSPDTQKTIVIVPEGSVGLGWFGWSVFGLASLIIVGCLAFIVASQRMWVRATASVVAVATASVVAVPAGLSLFKGGSLFKIEHVHVNFPKHLNIPEERPLDGKSIIELAMEINITSEKAQPPAPGPSGNVEFLCELNNRPLMVGTFVPGESKTLEVENRQTVEDLVEAIGILRRGKKLAGILLIGSADKTHLKRETERLYDSNFGLAQARALYVQDQLLDLKKGGDSRIEGLATILALNAGPSQLGPEKIDAKQLAIDRSVRACVMAQPEQQK